MANARDAPSSRSPSPRRAGDSLHSTWLNQGEPTSYYYPLIEVLRDECDLLSLVRLGCSSKLGRSLVTAVVHNNLQDTICRVLQATSACDNSRKPVCVLQWLQDAASEYGQQQQRLQQQHDVLAGQLNAGSLLLVQHVPEAAAKALVAAGLLINKQQLLEAARAQVAGLEVWLQAHQALDKPNVLLPGWAHAICCHKTQVSAVHVVLHALFSSSSALPRQGTRVLASARTARLCYCCPYQQHWSVFQPKVGFLAVV
jgi:hypothetical protein